MKISFDLTNLTLIPKLYAPKEINFLKLTNSIKIKSNFHMALLKKGLKLLIWLKFFPLSLLLLCRAYPLIKFEEKVQPTNTPCIIDLLGVDKE